jgi:hypothetical protein
MTLAADTVLRLFRIAIDDSVIADLKRSLAQVRWPDEAPEPPWTYGTSVGFMRELVDYWARDYDWRKTEAALNAYPQFVTTIDGIDVHFLKVEGRGPNPKPLLLSHGWPGSVLEFLKLIPLLTDPAAHGGDAADAFTVVVPSLPGCTLSFRPNQDHQLHRRVVLALLRAHARAVADRREHRRAHGLLRVSARDPAPAARRGRAGVHRPPALERDAQGRPLRRARAARGAGAGDPGVLPVPRLTSAGERA